MKKLWTFGCSTIAGCELGSGCSQDEISQWWTANTQYTNREDFLNNVNSDYQLQEDVFEKWWAYINKSESSKLSYGGQLAKILKRRLISKAVSGCGMDRVLFQLLKYKDKINWNNDLVIAELTPVYRYMTDELKEKHNQQLSLVTADCFKNVPSNTTLEYLYEGVLKTIKTEFPLVKLIDSGQVAETEKYKHYTINSDIKLNQIARKNTTKLIHVSYPGGHYVEDIHRQFADNLADLLHES
jgi:hypothetical protein